MGKYIANLKEELNAALSLNKVREKMNETERERERESSPRPPRSEPCSASGVEFAKHSEESILQGKPKGLKLNSHFLVLFLVTLFLSYFFMAHCANAALTTDLKAFWKLNEVSGI